MLFSPYQMRTQVCKELVGKGYMAVEALPNTQRVDVIDKRECPVRIFIEDDDPANALPLDYKLPKSLA